MKKIIKYNRLAIIFLMLLFSKILSSQCSSNFTWSINSGGNVTFSSTSTLANSVTTVYYWTYGNGIPTYSNTGSAGMYPNYTYTSNGVKTVTLIISSTSPTCISIFSQTLNITNAITCSLNANYSYTQGSNGLINFINTSTGTNSTTTYFWNFGNGNTSSSVSPVFTYTANGTYIATLTANNNSTPTCVSTRTVPVFVNSICNLSAGYTYNAGNNGLITFSNTTVNSSSLSPSSYTWNFGNSTISTNTNPSITYTANGNYTVTLLAQTSIPACTSTFVNVVSVSNAGCNMIANFNYSQSPNGIVNFSNTSTGTFSGTSYSWNFGDNTTSTLTSPPHTYSANGNYIATLTIQGTALSNTCVSTKTLLINVSSYCTWVSSFSTNTTNVNGFHTFFSTTFGAPSSNTYTWNFGNGITSNGAIATHSFSNGSYVISLSTSNPANPNCVSTSTTLLVVSNSTCALSTSFFANQNNNGLFNFFNVSQGVGNNATYTLNFGDGTIANSFVSSHTYTANGIYTPTLIINNNSTPTCSMMATRVLTVNSVCGLAANFNYVLNSNGNVSFFNTTTINVNTGTIIPSYTYTWSFGNGLTSNAFSPSMNYTSNGVYVVTLTANSTPWLCSSTKTLALAITNSTCTLNVNFVPISFTNNVMTFSNTSNGTNAGTTYTWSFQNGTGSNQFNPPPQSYTANGHYTTTLAASNGSICINSFSRVDTICSFVPAITFTQGFNGHATFSTNAVGANNINAYWHFGNSIIPYNTSFGTVVTRTLSNGIYTPTLYVNYSPTCQKSITTVITVTDNPCGLASSFSHTVGSNGFVTFSNTSVGNTPVTTNNWDFGDGWYSNNVHPNHTYMNGGVHYVSLTLQDTSNGYCVNTATMALNITGVNCVANSNFSLVPTATAQYWNAVLAYPYNITNAIWSWGDGGTSNVLYASHQYSASGNYSICLSVTASCGSTATSCYTYNVYKGNGAPAQIIYISVIPNNAELETGILTFNIDSDVRLYPNPNNGHFTLDLSKLQSGNIKLEIADILGNVIYTSNAYSNKQEQLEINLEEYNSGIYFLKVSKDNIHSTKKIIVNK